ASRCGRRACARAGAAARPPPGSAPPRPPARSRPAIPASTLERIASLQLPSGHPPSSGDCPRSGLHEAARAAVAVGYAWPVGAAGARIRIQTVRRSIVLKTSILSAATALALALGAPASAHDVRSADCIDAA